MSKSNILKSTSINGCDRHFLKPVEFPEFNSLGKKTRDLLHVVPNDVAGRVRFDLKSNPREYISKLDIDRIKCPLSRYFEEQVMPNTWSSRTCNEYKSFITFERQRALLYSASKFSYELAQINVSMTESTGDLREAQWVASEGDSKVQFIYPDPSSVKDALVSLYEFLRFDDSPSLFRATVALVAILSIHPFSDGNGRVSRLLFNILCPPFRETDSFIPLYEIANASQGGFIVRARKAQLFNEWDDIMEYMTYIADGVRSEFNAT